MESIDSNRQFCFVISSFNNAENIKNNLTSVFNQTYTNWRVIYINDCSTDNTEALFFELVKHYNFDSKTTYLKNDKRSGQAYSKYRAYKLLKDFEVVCLLDGDDWLSDNSVLARLNKLYSNQNVQMVSSNFKFFENGVITENSNFSGYSQDVVINKQFRKEYSWKVRHLKSGYGIFFKSIPKEYLTHNGEWLMVCTDIAEYYSALELSNGKYLAIDDVMYIYNKSNSLKYNTSYFRDESKLLHKNMFDHLASLPPCKYRLPQTYIINMAKCTNKHRYMKQQMLFQSNTNFKFIEAIDGSTNPETISLMKKYFDYMGIQNSSQTVTFDKSIMNSSYKNKYNFRRQHITKGSLGLIQSAFLLMNEFVKSDTDHILILEDDVYTMKHFHENLFINQELLKGKDLVYLGCHTSKHTIFSEKSDSIFIDIRNNEELIYGTYSIIISKQLAQYILSLGLDTILRLNLSWDLLLNYIRDTEKHRFTFFLYFKEVFIPNVIKKGGINPIKDVSFYTKNKIKLHDYYIPDVNNNHTENDIAHIMSTHNENLFFDFVTKAVYINLEDRVDRKEHAEQQLLKYIDSSKIFRFNAIRNAKGAVGCGLSHIAVLEMAIAEKWDNVFIAEDDILWTNEFQHGHDILESLIRRDYDVIVLGGTFIKSYKNSFKLISCNCALAYIVNKSYFQPLLQCFKDGIVELIKTDNQSKYAIDQAWKPLQRSDNWYIIKPNMCMQLPSYSNIENTFKDYTSYFDRLIEYTDSFNIDYFSNLNYHNKVFNPVETKPHETDDAYNSNNDTDWSKSVKVRNLRFEVNKETDRNTKPPEETITIKPLNIAKRYFDYKEEPTIYSTEQFILNPPSFRKIFTFKSKENKADNNKNYITRDNKSYSVKNIKFNIPEAPPSIPEPTLVSFKYLLNMLKMK